MFVAVVLVSFDHKQPDSTIYIMYNIYIIYIYIERERERFWFCKAGNHSGRSRYQIKNCGRELSKSQSNYRFGRGSGGGWDTHFADHHSKSSYRMDPSGNQIPRQTPNNMAQNNPWRDQISRQNMEWSQSTRQKPCQMAKLCEGPMFPWGKTGNYYYY